MTWRNRVEISYSAIRNNVAAVRAAAGGRQVIAVVKADAYGIGLERCARLYYDGGVAALAVAAMSEGDRIRRIVPNARVILLGSPLPEERRSVIFSRYEVCCSSVDEIHEYAHMADPLNPLPVHVMVDTGMGRFGAVPADAVRMVERIVASPALRLAGIGTHYPQADDVEFAEQQERDFAALVAQLLDSFCQFRRVIAASQRTCPRGASRFITDGRCTCRLSRPWGATGAALGQQFKSNEKAAAWSQH